MTNQDRSAARAAVQAFVRGRTVELGAVGPDGSAVDSGLEGVEVRVAPPAMERDAGNPFVDLSGVEPGSVDAIVSVGGLASSHDLAQEFQAWRRVLREGGTLALAFVSEEGGAHRWSASAVVSISQLVGGFKTTRMEEIGADGFLFVAERSTVQLVRTPLAFLGPEIAAACAEDDALRTELAFQFGTILVQSNDPEGALPHFESVLAREPGSADARFGRGMCLARTGRWSEALDELQRCAALDPGNEAIRSWVDLARERVQQSADAAPRAAAAGILSPQGAVAQPAPAPASANAAQSGLRAGRGALRISSPANG